MKSILSAAVASAGLIGPLESDHNTNCCGLVEVHGFPVLDKPLTEAGLEELQRRITAAIKSEDDFGYDHSDRAIAFITLTDQQAKHLNDPLIKLGFVPGVRGHNKDSGNNLTIYTGVINEVPAPAVPKRRRRS